MNVLGYIRVSSSKQVNEGNSLVNQEYMIQEYCLKNNLNLIGVIKDEGISGLKKERSGILEIRSLIDSNKIDVVVVYSLSRVGRRLKDLIEFLDYLNKKNIKFISLKEGFVNEGIMGKLMLNIMGSVNEFEVMVMGERISDVKRFKKMNKEVFGGRICYGVDVIDGKLIGNKDELEILGIMRELRDMGWSYFRISNYMNENRIKSKYNSKWYGSSVRMCLLNGIDEIEYVSNDISV